jgi:translocon-associated protein subunit alpha
MLNLKKLLLCLFIALPIVTLLAGNSCYAAAVEDELDPDDDTVDVEPDGDTLDTAVTEDEDIGAAISKSPDAETTILFIKPKPGLIGSSGTPELHSGKVVEFLVGFVNKGAQGFTLENLDASFRYPQDYSFHIQNFSSAAYNKLVKPKEQATLSYSFYVDESFAGRPFGLTINLGYRDVEGKPFMDAVYNETVSVVEIEEGLDGETFFLYVFLAALVVLLLVVGQHFLTSFSKKSSSRKAPVERGTVDSDDVDYEWLPEQTLRGINKASPKQSPRQRKADKAK